MHAHCAESARRTLLKEAHVERVEILLFAVLLVVGAVKQQESHGVANEQGELSCTSMSGSAHDHTSSIGVV